MTRISEQDSTDFEKCLYAEAADLYIGLGFLGRRLDHSLACLRTLAAYPDKRVILIGDGDLVFLCPASFSIRLVQGTRVSVFPMARVHALGSHGLRWPLDGLDMQPDGQIGTSNEAIGGMVEMRFAAPKALVTLPVAELENVVSRLRPGL